MSPFFPLPSTILFRISRSARRPSLQGRHLPHDSSLRKSMKYRATSTMQVSSSITIMPPEPIIEPASVSASKSTGRSRSDSGRHPPEGPPVCTALNFLPFGTPPPMSKMISRSVIPMGTSTRPVLLTLPTRENIFVPLLPPHGFALTSPVPIFVYQSTPAENDLRHVRPRLDVVEHGRLLPEPLLDRVNVLRARLARLAFERGHERRRFAADERAAAARYRDIERETAAENVSRRAARIRAPARAPSSAPRRRAGTRSSRR